MVKCNLFKDILCFTGELYTYSVESMVETFHPRWKLKVHSDFNTIGCVIKRITVQRRIEEKENKT